VPHIKFLLAALPGNALFVMSLGEIFLFPVVRLFAQEIIKSGSNASQAEAILKTSRGTSRLQCGIIFSGDVILINTGGSAALYPSLRGAYKKTFELTFWGVYSLHPPAAQANCCDIKKANERN
jgi:hypothetical protein